MQQRSILFLRHAKSSWEDVTLDDHERPLKNRGINDIVLLSEHCKHLFNPVEIVYCSSARRAQDTWQLFSEKLEGPAKQTEIDYRWYTFSEQVLSGLIRSVPETYQHIAVVGHNPALENIIRALGGSIAKLPTSGMVKMVLSDSWEQLRKAQLTDFLYPKLFR